MLTKEGTDYTKHASPTAKSKPKEFLLSKKDMAMIKLGSPKLSKKLPKLAEIKERAVIDTKALGAFWKGEANLYYDMKHILSIE